MSGHCWQGGIDAFKTYLLRSGSRQGGQTGAVAPTPHLEHGNKPPQRPQAGVLEAPETNPSLDLNFDIPNPQRTPRVSVISNTRAEV